VAKNTELLKKHARTGENNSITLEITAYKLRGKT